MLGLHVSRLIIHPANENVIEEAFDIEYQDRDQGGDNVLRIGHESPFVEPVRLVGWGMAKASVNQYSFLG